MDGRLTISHRRQHDNTESALVNTDEMLQRLQSSDITVTPPGQQARGTKRTAQRNSRNATPCIAGELVAAGGFAAANASGFAVYQGTSVALHGAASTAGMTLPFGAYTGASTVLSIAFGPVGWGLLGASLIWKLLR